MATQSPAPPPPGGGGGGGGNEKPQGEGPELSPPAGGSAQNEATNEFQQKVPFIIAEPMREDQVQNAVKFLSHPKVRGSPIIYRRSFLERKGLTKEEIDEAFSRVPDPPPNVKGADTVATTQANQPRTSTSLQPQAPIQSPPLPAAQVGSISLASVSQQPRFTWSNALFAIGVLSASGAGTAVLLKKVVLPRLKGWIKRVAAEDNVSMNEEKSSKRLAEETAEAAKAAASAAAIVATASQELLNSKNEDRKYFEAFMKMVDVQVKEMKSMSEAIHKLEKAREQDKLIEEYVHSATANGTSNNSWGTSQVNQIDTVRNTTKVNGTPTAVYGPGTQSLAPASVESTSVPHSKSYMEIMAMVQRGEKPPNIREINDMPPNPNQAPSKPIVAPRTKPWEVAQQSAESQENGKSQDVSSEPWWRKKSVKITEIDSEGEEGSLRQFPYSTGSSERPATQRTWVPPQPPSVSIPEAAAAIKHPKPPPPIQKQYSDDENMMVGSNGSDVAAGTSNSGGDMDASGSTAAVPHHSEIEEERADGIEAI